MRQIEWVEDLPTISLPDRSDYVYPPDQAPSKRDPVPRFGDDVWSFRFFSNNPSMQSVHIDWRSVPIQYVEHFRLAIWALFNVPLPDEMIARMGAPTRASLGALRIYHSAIEYRMLGRWLEERGVTKVADLSTTLMGDYAEYLRSDRRVARATAVNHLTALTRLWIIGMQIPTLRLGGPPPWVVRPFSDYLPDETRATGENLAEPINAATMSSLLLAAVRYINVGADPILRAAESELAIYRSIRRKRNSGGTGAAALRAYLSELNMTGAPVPTKIHNGKLAIDCAYIAHTVGVSVSSVYNWTRLPETRDYVVLNRGTTTVDLVKDDLFPAKVPRTDVARYVNLLEAACYIVIAYLTGMRPGEVLAMEAGCLRSSGGNGGWMLIFSRTFKTARDENGNHDSNGQMRSAPWVAVAPVVQAIRTLEKIVGEEGLLFPSSRIDNQGRSKGLYTAAERVTSFIDHVNDRQPNSIPDDPLGRVTPSRFRRTLAWHIANQPGGIVALAVQYGHLRTAISESYASRVRDGIHDLIDFETARTIAGRLSVASTDFDEGQGVSGPATFRFVAALRDQSVQFNGVVTSLRQARSLLGAPHLAVYQNDDAFVWCNFNRDSALCLNETDSSNSDTPNLDRCDAKCSNICRTDNQASAMRDAALKFRREAGALPRSAAERLTARALTLEARAGTHDRERRTRADFDDPS